MVVLVVICVLKPLQVVRRARFRTYVKVGAIDIIFLIAGALEDKLVRLPCSDVSRLHAYGALNAVFAEPLEVMAGAVVA